MLTIRARQLEAVQQRFAAQQQNVVRLQSLLKETHEQIRLQMKPDSLNDADPIWAQQRFRYIQYLKEQAALISQKWHCENQKLELIREEMRQAHVQKKSLERLSEKQQTAYYQKIAEHEEKELEDLVMARRHRA